MRTVWILTACLGGLAISAGTVWGQPQTAQPEAAEVEESSAAETEPAEGEAAEEPAGGEKLPPLLQPPVEPVNPRVVQLHLFDGSVITGELSVDHVKVSTQFGDLTVPVEKLVSFSPGLDSYPERLKRIEMLIEAIGGDDFNIREQAQKELAKMGVGVLAELRRHEKDPNAERRQRIAALLKEFEDYEFEAESDFGDSAERPWERADRIITTDFTIVGKITTESFEITSKYGPLQVSLADIRRAERRHSGRPEITKTLALDQTSLPHGNWKSSGVRVESGDRIVVRADGQITMTPWGSEYSTTPDGGANYDWLVPNEIPYGSLVAKIGNNGKVFKVGTKYEAAAKSAGTLYFAVALDPDYTNEGYTFPGQYRVRLKIEPK